MKFSMFAESAHGQKYRERGLPCQDSSSTMEFNGVQVVAVADGHGGKDYFRSDKGARLAIEVLFEQIKIFCRDLNADERFSDAGIKNFLFAVCNGWRDAVLNDWRENPFSPRELRWETVSDKYKARFTSSDENISAQYVPVAYGTTLLAAISIGAQVLLIQIGDGTCAVLQQNGEFKVPVPTDSENFFNVTTSLCEADAVTKFRHVVLNCDDSPLAPVAIFLSTDGLDDCYPIFENEKWLYKLYADTVIDSLIENGPASTRDALRDELLPYLTERGSNDDISLAYLVTRDQNLLKQTLEEFHALAVAQVESSPTPQSTAQVAQKFSTAQSTAQVAQKFSTPQSTAQVAQKFSTPQSTAQVAQKFSTPQSTAQVAQKFSTPQSTAQVESPPTIAEQTDAVREKLRARYQTDKGDKL